MSYSLSRATIIGRLGQDPEVRQSKAGDPYCQFNLATNRPKKTEDGWEDQVSWHKIRSFGNIATRCGERLEKGALVSVDGPLVEDRWVDSNGNKRRQGVVIAQRVVFMSRPTINAETPKAK